MISMLVKASQITRNHKGFRHIKGYDYHGIPHHERRFWRVRDKVLWALHCGVKILREQQEVNHG